MNLKIRSLSLIAIAASAAALSTGTQAQQAPKPEQLIKWRQSAYQVVGWNSGRIKASLDGTYNKEEVARAAGVIAALANAGLGGLFVPGTESGKGWHETAAKPELFQDGKRVGEAAANFSKEANELARVAVVGDLATIKDQYGKLSRTCKACHDDFRAKE